MARKKRRRRRTVTKRARRRVVRRAVRAAEPDNVASYLTAAHRSLLDERARLDRRIAALEQALAAFRGSLPSGARPAAARGRAAGRYRAGSLKDYILRVLSGGQTMAVKDITASVTRAGYQSRNKTLAKSVGIALAQMPELIKVGRGRYRLK